MTLFILHHLLAVLLTGGYLLALLVTLALCRAASLNSRQFTDWPYGAPVIRLDWIADLPVCEIVSDPATAADVAAWLEAVREGTVVRV